MLWHKETILLILGSLIWHHSFTTVFWNFCWQAKKANCDFWHLPLNCHFTNLCLNPCKSRSSASVHKSSRHIYIFQVQIECKVAPSLIQRNLTGLSLNPSANTPHPFIKIDPLIVNTPIHWIVVKCNINLLMLLLLVKIQDIQEVKRYVRLVLKDQSIWKLFPLSILHFQEWS